MASAVAAGDLVMFRAVLAVRQPGLGIVLREWLLVRGEELDRLGPESRDRLRRVVDVDREAVGLVVIAHVAEDIVVNVAVEIDMRLHAPVVLHILQRRVFVEHAAVPSAHLVVRLHACVLDVLLFQDLRALLHQVQIYPRWNLPVLFRDDLISALGFGVCLRCRLEFLCEGLVVEECPWVVELVVPRTLQLLHATHNLLQLAIPDQR